MRALGHLTVNLKAVAENYSKLCTFCGPKVSVAAVVKADAYGLGARAVAEKLLSVGCDQFYVATLDEALDLRDLCDSKSAKASIAVLLGVTSDPEIYHRAHLTPVLNSLEDLKTWPQDSSAILHIDTGMNRLGLAQDHIEKAKDHTIDLILSHFACAEHPDHPKNAEQIKTFAHLQTLFGGGAGSLANSAGIFLSPAAHFQQVRSGGAIYGLNPHADKDSFLQPVAQIQAQILQTRTAHPNETVGYGANHVFSAQTRLATVAFGYADGYFRTLSNGAGRLFHQNHALPIVGRVSMDLITVDISAAPDLKPGDWVDIIGPAQSVDDLACQAQTISYEVLTALGPHCRRTYTGEVT